MTVRDKLMSLPLARQLTVDRHGLGRAVQSQRSRQLAPRTRYVEMNQSICPYCAVDCGQGVCHRNGEVIQIEGDPDSPISRGRLCPKGAASEQLVNNPLREYRMKYRGPHGTEWETSRSTRRNVTSPMSVGSWVLSAYGGAATLAGLSELTGRAPRTGVAVELAGALDTALATYTALLRSDTAVPAWHQARHELPFVFAGGTMASAAAAVLSPVGEAGPARRLTVAGAALELGAAQVLEHRLGELGEPYHEAGSISSTRRPSGSPPRARSCWRSSARGFSRRDPKYTVVPQRRRVDGAAAQA